MGAEQTPDELNRGPEPNSNLGVQGKAPPKQSLLSKVRNWLTGNQREKTREAPPEARREPPAQGV